MENNKKMGNLIVIEGGRDKTPIEEALDRGERFKKKIKKADPVTRQALFADWKKLLLENMVSVLEVTENTALLAILDTNIGLGLTQAENEGRITPKRDRVI